MAVEISDATTLARDEWLAVHRDGEVLTASMVATAMGHNPFCTPLKLYGQIIGAVPWPEETERMRLGHKAEPFIAELYEDETKRPAYNLGEYTMQRHDDFPLVMSTLDRTTCRRAGCVVSTCQERGPLQLKLVGWRMARHWEDEIPLYVQIQEQVEMAATGWEWASVAALLGGERFTWGDLERNDLFIKHMYGAVERFLKMVKNREEPPAEWRDADTLKMIHPQHVEGDVIQLPGNLLEADDEIAALKRVIKTANDELEGHENKIKQAIGDAERGVLPNGAAYTWKSQEANIKAREAYVQRKRVLRRTTA